MTDGLYGIITVKIPEPQVEGQTKGRLGNSYVRGAVEELTYNYLKDYFAENPEEFDKGAYKISGGLHGVGASVVNALSTWLEVTVYKNGKIHKMRFEKGVPQGELQIVGETDKT